LVPPRLDAFASLGLSDSIPVVQGPLGTGSA